MSRKKQIPGPDVQTLYVQLKNYRKAEVKDDTVDPTLVALEHRWPALRNLSPDPTLTFGKALLFGLIGMCVGLMLVGIAVLVWG